MRSSRIALLAAAMLIVAACGAAQEETDGPRATPDSTAPPTTTTAIADPDTSAGENSTTSRPPVTTTTAGPGKGGVTDADATDSGAEPDVVAGDTDVFVYLLADPGAGSHSYECGDVIAVPRLVQSPEVLTGAFGALLAGPTDAELSAGHGSWFSAEVGWELASVTVANGTAYIDFTEESEPIPNASTSCGSTALMAQLDYTAKQFPTVTETVYSFDGDVAAFYHWLQRDVPKL